MQPPVEAVLGHELEQQSELVTSVVNAGAAGKDSDHIPVAHHSQRVALRDEAFGTDLMKVKHFDGNSHFLAA